MSIKFNYDRMKTASLRSKTAAAFGGSSSSSGGFGGSPSGNLGQGSSGRTMYNPVYDDLSEGTIIEQFMPVDPRRLHRIWRRIYLQDPVAGPAVELYKELPWSEFTLAGIKDKNVLQFYSDALNAININAHLPEMSSEFITMGKVIGHLHMDESRGYYSKLIVHDPDWIKVSSIPIPGYQPKLDIIPTPQMRRWASSEDPRDADSLAEISHLVDAIKNGHAIPLPPEQSFYLPRKTSPYDTIGASAYTRIIMFVAYEKALINGTIAASKRRLSQIRHISVGLDDWEPSPQELDGYAGLFMQADEDPVGAIVVTRTGVTANTIGGGTLSDVVKISDEWAFLQAGKLNSLGVSEAFLRGEASYNSLEQLMSVFLEKIRAHRNFFTHYLLLDRILKPLAQKHQFVKRTEAELSHRVRVSSSHSEDLLLPDFKWEKSLRPTADRDYLEILEFMQGKGLPVTMRAWAAAGGINLDSEIQQFEDDLELRKQLSAHIKQIQDVAPETMAGGSGNFGSGIGSGMGGMGDIGGTGSNLGLDLDTGTGLDSTPDMDMTGPSDLSTPPAEVPETAPEVPSNISLPTVGASFKGAGYVDSDSIKSLRALPHWNAPLFLGVSLEVAEYAAKHLLGSLDNQDRKVLSKKEVDTLLRTGNAARDQVLQYILARAGILHGIYLSSDIASSVTDKLLDIVTDRSALKTELSYVYAYSLAKPELPNEPQRASGNIPNLIKSSVSYSEKNQNTLLTGFVDSTNKKHT